LDYFILTWPLVPNHLVVSQRQNLFHNTDCAFFSLFADIIALNHNWLSQTGVIKTSLPKKKNLMR
jgi:hypothetical protein